jgi:hypothetical protein
MKRNIRLGTLTYVLFEIQSAIEKGHVNTVTFKQFYSELDAKTLFHDIGSAVRDDIDLSLITGQPDQQNPYLEMLESIRAALEGRERQKTGIENSGLLLLAAYTTEIIQQYGWDIRHERTRMDQEDFDSRK